MSPQNTGRRLTQCALHGIKAAAVRAARAQHRRADRQGLLGVGVVVGCRVFCLRQFGDAEVDGQTDKDVVDVVLAAIARFARQLAVRVVFGMCPARKRQQLVFEHVVELFEHEHIGQTLGELGARALREREGSAHLPETICRQLHAAFVRTLLQQAKRLKRVGSRHAARDDAMTSELAGHASLVDGIECAQNRVRRVIDGNRAQALVDFSMALIGALREDDPTRPRSKPSSGWAWRAFPRQRRRTWKHDTHAWWGVR